MKTGQRPKIPRRSKPPERMGWTAVAVWVTDPERGNPEATHRARSGMAIRRRRREQGARNKPWTSGTMSKLAESSSTLSGERSGTSPVVAGLRSPGPPLSTTGTWTRPEWRDTLGYGVPMDFHLFRATLLAVILASWLLFPFRHRLSARTLVEEPRSCETLNTTDCE